MGAPEARESDTGLERPAARGSRKAITQVRCVLPYPERVEAFPGRPAARGPEGGLGHGSRPGGAKNPTPSSAPGRQLARLGRWRSSPWRGPRLQPHGAARFGSAWAESRGSGDGGEFSGRVDLTLVEAGLAGRHAMAEPNSQATRDLVDREPRPRGATSIVMWTTRTDAAHAARARSEGPEPPACALAAPLP